MHTQFASPGHTPTHKTLSKQRSFNNYPKLSFYLLTTSGAILIFIQIQALKFFIPLSPSSSSPSSSSSWSSSLPHWRHRKSTKEPAPAMFLPLKNLSLASTAMDGNTWFMSSLNDTREPGEPEHLFFPSEESGNRLLCLTGRDERNGTRNYYALVPPDSLPPNARLLPGLTFVSDTYYDYTNLFHSLMAVVPFVAWHETKNCVMPARWVLYHWGELRKSMSPWIASIVEAVFGENTDIEKFEGSNDNESRPSCFEEAVVFRHNEGSMSRERKEEVYGMIRCKARAYCNITREAGDEKAIRMTLLLRTGARSFKDEEAIARIFGKECNKVDGCRLKVTRADNLTFCDQVKLMSSTDILASPHGAQLTNLFFMDKNSSVMEFFPKGWLEFAGPGQYAFHWIAAGSGMRHKGAWRDPDGEECPDRSNPSKCFAFYKGGRIGHDEGYFAKWAAEVIGEMKEYKLGEESARNWQKESSNSCLCSKQIGSYSN